MRLFALIAVAIALLYAQVTEAGPRRRGGSGSAGCGSGGCGSGGCGVSQCGSGGCGQAPAALQRGIPVAARPQLLPVAGQAGAKLGFASAQGCTTCTQAAAATCSNGVCGISQAGTQGLRLGNVRIAQNSGQCGRR